MAMCDLAGKIALVTGAQRGMGRTHALLLAQQGATVIVTDVDQSACENVVAEIEQAGGTAQAYAMDVTQIAQIHDVFDQVIEQYGRLDILVNNAGIYKPKMALDISEEEWNRTVDVNLKGYFFCAQRAAKEMQKHNWGRIINIASIASGAVGVGVAGGSHYTATKGGVVGLTEALAVEFAPLGITVNCIGPGAIDTPMVAEADMDDAAMQGLLAGVPLKRMGKPEEVSTAVVFLASDEASYITGATLYVDGGWLAA